MKTNAFSNATKLLTDLIITKVETISSDWRKPWFTKSVNSRNFLPQNLEGRTYKGGNAISLLFLCELYNYRVPVFVTAKKCMEVGLNFAGKKPFPIYYTMFCAYHKETNERISYEEYKQLKDEEQKEYRLAGTHRFYYVFNVEQTNIEEILPNEWEALKKKFEPEEEKEDSEEIKEMYSNSLLDEMLNKQSWICKIKSFYSDRAFFSPTADYISLPSKNQFTDGESFYATELHEMIHSTGVKERLNRTFGKSFGDKNYGREELVAELGSALLCLFFGISAGIREENIQYLKSWVTNIKEEPKFILSVLTDTMKAVKFTANHLGLDIEQMAEESEIVEVA